MKLKVFLISSLLFFDVLFFPAWAIDLDYDFTIENLEQTFPDLIMTQVSGPSSAQLGASITISDTVLDQQTTTTGASSFDVGFYLSTDATITASDLFLGSRHLPGLDPGQSNSGSTVITIPSNIASGNYYIGAISDFNAWVPESSESNNSLAGNAITILPAGASVNGSLPP